MHLEAAQNNYPIVYIVSLNWNGESDTMSMLMSLSKLSYSNYHIVLIDNGSELSSYNKVLNWLKSSEDYILEAKSEVFQQGIEVVGKGNRITFIKSDENLGFSKGSNVGCKYAQSIGGEFVLLLNNDTEVEPDFLSVLMEKYLATPSLGALIPQIRYFHNKELIWNCGGKIFFGFRRYYFQSENYKKLPSSKELKVAFATGCALLFKPNEVGLLTEKFFFGEEDFEFAYRLKRLKKEMVCVLDSIIYHKVGQSKHRNVKGINKGAIFIHYLNRFINMRSQFSNRLLWEFWRIVHCFYIFMLLINKLKFQEVLTFIGKLYVRSMRLTSVNRFEFEKTIKEFNAN